MRIKIKQAHSLLITLLAGPLWNKEDGDRPEQNETDLNVQYIQGVHFLRPPPGAQMMRGGQGCSQRRLGHCRYTHLSKTSRSSFSSVAVPNAKRWQHSAIRF